MALVVQHEDPESDAPFEAYVVVSAVAIEYGNALGRVEATYYRGKSSRDAGRTPALVRTWGVDPVGVERREAQEAKPAVLPAPAKIDPDTKEVLEPATPGRPAVPAAAFQDGVPGFDDLFAKGGDPRDAAYAFLKTLKAFEGATDA
jgi:hypothetical protein